MQISSTGKIEWKGSHRHRRILGELVGPLMSTVNPCVPAGDNCQPLGPRHVRPTQNGRVAPNGWTARWKTLTYKGWLPKREKQPSLQIFVWILEVRLSMVVSVCGRSHVTHASPNRSRPIKILPLVAYYRKWVIQEVFGSDSSNGQNTSNSDVMQNYREHARVMSVINQHWNYKQVSGSSVQTVASYGPIRR